MNKTNNYNTVQEALDTWLMDRRYKANVLADSIQLIFLIIVNFEKEVLYYCNSLTIKKVYIFDFIFTIKERKLF